MKKFDLEAAKAGAPIITRDGREEKYKMVADKIHFDSKTGIFTWGIESGKFSGKQAGSLNSDGYIRIGITKKGSVPAHRLAWYMHYNEVPNGEIDHINHNRADNRIENLRLVKRQENSKNRKRYCTNTSGLSNTYFHKKNKRWIAKVQRTYLGCYATQQEAFQISQKYMKENGFHKNHGLE